MANFNLTGQKIKNTYDQLAQVSASLLVDGLGNATTISASNIQNFDTEVSKSAAEAGFGGGGGTWPVSGTPDGIVSSSAQTIANLPSGTVSGSSQVDISQASGDATNARNILRGADSSNNNRFVGFTDAQSGFGELRTHADLTYNPTERLMTVTASHAQDAISSSFSNTTTNANVNFSVSDVVRVMGAYGTAEDTPLDIVGNTDVYFDAGDGRFYAPNFEGTASVATSASYSVTASHALNAGEPFPFTGSADIQGTINMNANGKIQISNYTGSLHETSILIGQELEPSRINAPGDRNVQIGHYSRIVDSSTRSNIVVIGSDAEAAQNTVVIGQSARSLTDAGVAIGQATQTNDNYSVTVGAASITSAQRAVNVGYNNTVSNSGSIAIGSNITLQTSNHQINVGNTWTYDGSTRTTIDSVLNLTEQNPLPTGQVGDLAVSASALYFHNGTSWGVIS